MREKDYRLEVRLSKEEMTKLISQADKAKLSRSEMIRRLIMNCRICEAPPAEYYDLIIEVRRVGSNLNQLMKVANSIGYIDTEKLKGILADNRKTEQLLWNTFSPEPQ